MPRTQSPATEATRRTAIVEVSASLLEEARDLAIDISKACEAGLAAKVAQTKAQQWLAENRAAMDEWNDYVAKHGLPLADYRPF